MKPFWVFAGLIIAISGLFWLVTVKLRVGKGALRACERAFLGAAALIALSEIVKPLGIHIAQSPLTALSAGLFGAPGIVGCLFLQGL